MSKPLIVLDADVLGRQRTGDESYVSALLRELPRLDSEFRFGAVTRHPECVPDGVQRGRPSGSQFALPGAAALAVSMPAVSRRAIGVSR